MTDPSTPENELERLLIEQVEGELTLPQQQHLAALLRDDRRRQEKYIDYLHLDAVLNWEQPDRISIAPLPELEDGRRTRAWLVLIFAVTAATVLVALVWQRTRPQVEFVRGVGHEFANSGIWETHREIIGEKFDLAAGLVELRFRKADATVVIEAPARFRIEDARTLRIEDGRVTAHVRDGTQGLRVLTPDADVLDLGTRFAVDVMPGRHSEVHVFEGKVEAGTASSSERRVLVANEALRFNGKSKPETCDVRSGAFVQCEELMPLAAGLHADQDRRARRAFDRYRRDPALLAAIDFEGRGDEPSMEVNGARRVQGRFPGSSALDFVDVDDRVHLDWNVVVRRFTLMTWVRLNDELGASDYSSVYHTDGWDTLGQVHWMIRCGDGFMGRMRFGIHGGPVEGNPRSTLWAVSEDTVLHTLNRWTHLALTYDADEQQVAFYIDGKFDTAGEIPRPLSAVLGPAEIGNWNPNLGKVRRRLCGRMDELLILSRTLSEAEVNTYYRESSPYR